jgi:hypothetical protein
MGYF